MMHVLCVGDFSDVGEWIALALACGKTSFSFLLLIDCVNTEDHNCIIQLNFAFFAANFPLLWAKFILMNESTAVHLLCLG